MTINLRGRKGLLKHLPLPWQNEKYELLRDAVFQGKAYANTNSYREYKLSKAPPIYTGLVVDVSEFKFNPSLAPRIYSRAGRLLYGPEFIIRLVGVRRGIAAFAKSFRQSNVKNRAGRHPLLTIALAVNGKYRTDAVISDKDAELIFQAKQTIRNLQKCRVVFLINK